MQLGLLVLVGVLGLVLALALAVVVPVWGWRHWERGPLLRSSHHHLPM